MTDEQVRSYIKTLRNQAEALIRRADDEARPIALTLYQEQIERRSMRSDAKWKTELAAHLEAGLADSEQAARDREDAERWRSVVLLWEAVEADEYVGFHKCSRSPEFVISMPYENDPGTGDTPEAAIDAAREASE